MRIRQVSRGLTLPAGAAFALAGLAGRGQGQEPPPLPSLPLEVESRPAAPDSARPSHPSAPWQQARVDRLRNPFMWDGRATPQGAPAVAPSPQGGASPQSLPPGTAGAAAPATTAGTGVGADTGAGAAPSAAASAFANAVAAGAGADTGAGAGAAPGFGGGLAATQDVVPMIGDQGPFSVSQAVRFPPIPTPLPPGQPGPDPRALAGHTTNRIVPSVRGFKIADNQSPRPMDRVFVSFNYFQGVNGDLNRRFNTPIDREKIYHEVFGFEKTFFNQNASFGLRVPLNSLSIDSRFPGLGGTNTGVGNLNVFGKFILAEDRKTGSLISGGLSVIAPTGPSAFASFPTIRSQNTTQIQPFVAYILNRQKWFFQGFFSVDVPTNRSMATMMYIDNGIGYYLHRNEDPTAFLTAIVPTFETHLNTPLNSRGYSVSNVAGTPDVLDLTFGSTFTFRRRTLLTFAYVTPVTGPRPFSGELALFFNYRFGGMRNLVPTPPPATGG